MATLQPPPPRFPPAGSGAQQFWARCPLHASPALVSCTRHMSLSLHSPIRYKSWPNSCFTAFFHKDRQLACTGGMLCNMIAIIPVLVGEFLAAAVLSVQLLSQGCICP